MRVPGLGTIIDRHERGFYCRWRRKGYADMLRKAGTERNAKRVLSLVQARRLDGASLEAAVRSVFGDPEPEGMTLAKLADLYLDGLASIRTPGNLKRERWTAGAFKAEFKRTNPAKLDPAGVARWAEKLGRTRSSKTVNRHLSLGSKIWRYSQQNGYAPLTFNPFRILDRAREIPKGRPTFTRTELDALLARMPADIADYALAATQTAWRPIELQALTWADINQGTIRVPASADKARKGKTVAISGRLSAALEARRGLPRALVFVHPSGRPWNSKTRGKRFSDALTEAIKAKEIPEHKADATWYVLKGAGLTVLLSQGTSPAVVAQMSGVAITTILKHYAAPMQDAQAEALKLAWGD